MEGQMTILRYVEKGEPKNLQPDEEYVPVREFLEILKAAHEAEESEPSQSTSGAAE